MGVNPLREIQRDAVRADQAYALFGLLESGGFNRHFVRQTVNEQRPRRDSEELRADIGLACEIPADVKQAFFMGLEPKASYSVKCNGGTLAISTGKGTVADEAGLVKHTF